MIRVNDLQWHDLEWRAAALRRPEAAFPLVHQRLDRFAPDDDDDLAAHAFFQARPTFGEPDAHEAFDDLFEPSLACLHTRRYRRFFVRLLGAASIAAIFVGTGFGARDHGAARSAMTEWATFGAMR